jgi:hypothetical protein
MARRVLGGVAAETGGEDGNEAGSTFDRLMGISQLSSPANSQQYYNMNASSLALCPVGSRVNNCRDRSAT